MPAKHLGPVIAARQAKAMVQGAPQEQQPPVDKPDPFLQRESDAMFNYATKTEDVCLVAVKLLRPYANHPFKPHSGEKLAALAESIQNDGLHHPIIIREVKGVFGYEILSGHNRVEAMRKLGRRDIPAILRDLDDNSASLLVVDANLAQREKLLPSEKAFAYRMQLEALQNNESAEIKRGRKASAANVSANSAQIGQNCTNREVVAKSYSVDRHEIQRYIRLTYLIPELLELLDQRKCPMMAGYEISFLSAKAQKVVYDYFFQANTKDKLSINNAKAIRAAYDRQVGITSHSIEDAIRNRSKKKKRSPTTVSFPLEGLARQYDLPEGFDLAAFVHEKLGEEYSL